MELDDLVSALRGKADDTPARDEARERTREEVHTQRKARRKQANNEKHIKSRKETAETAFRMMSGLGAHTPSITRATRYDYI
jgi:hypothetical protein